MIFELVVTSVKRALQAGRTGFAPVMRTRGMHPDLQQRLEALSGYRHAFPQGDPRNPVIRAHSVVESAAGKFSVLSRIVDAGSDHTGRSNKVAHHVACDATEIRSAARSSPAALLLWLEQRNAFSSRWDADPQEKPAPASFAYPAVAPGPCMSWQRFAGDAGWAGVLVERALKGQPTWIIGNPGIDMLPLFAEALALVEPSRRWGISFTTMALADKGFLWMTAAEGSAEARVARGQPGALVIDLGRPCAAPDAGPYAQAARGLAEVPWAPKAAAAPRAQQEAPAPRPMAGPAPSVASPAVPRMAPPPMIGATAPPGLSPPGLHPSPSIDGRLSPSGFSSTPSYRDVSEFEHDQEMLSSGPSRRSRQQRVPLFIAAAAAALVFLVLIGGGVEYLVSGPNGFVGRLVAMGRINESLPAQSSSNKPSSNLNPPQAQHSNPPTIKSQSQPPNEKPAPSSQEPEQALPQEMPSEPQQPVDLESARPNTLETPTDPVKPQPSETAFSSFMNEISSKKHLPVQPLPTQQINAPAVRPLVAAPTTSVPIEKSQNALTLDLLMPPEFYPESPSPARFHLENQDAATWLCLTTLRPARVTIIDLRIEKDGSLTSTTQPAAFSDKSSSPPNDTSDVLRDLTSCCLLVRDCTTDRWRQTYIQLTSPQRLKPLTLTPGEPQPLSENFPDFTKHGSVDVTFFIRPDGGQEVTHTEADVKENKISFNKTLPLPSGYATTDLSFTLELSKTATDDPPQQTILLKTDTSNSNTEANHKALKALLKTINQNNLLTWNELSEWMTEERNILIESMKKSLKMQGKKDKIDSRFKQNWETAQKLASNNFSKSKHKDLKTQLQYFESDYLEYFTQDPGFITYLQEVAAQKVPSVKDEPEQARNNRVLQYAMEKKFEICESWSLQLAEKLEDDVKKGDLSNWGSRPGTTLFELFPRLHIYKRLKLLPDEASRLKGRLDGLPLTVRIRVTRKLRKLDPTIINNLSQDSITPESVILFDTE